MELQGEEEHRCQKKKKKTWFSSNQISLLNAFYYSTWEIEVVNVIIWAFVEKKKKRKHSYEKARFYMILRSSVAKLC